MRQTQAEPLVPVAVSNIDPASINGPVLHRPGHPDRNPYISVVVPIFNEVESIEALLTELERATRHGFAPGELERAKAWGAALAQAMVRTAPATF